MYTHHKMTLRKSKNNKKGYSDKLEPKPLVTETGNADEKNKKDQTDSGVNNNLPSKDKQPTKTKGNLQIKTVRIMKRKPPGKFKCEFCNHVPTAKKQLNSHHVPNHGKVKCAVCSEKFNIPCALHRHKYRHSDNKFICKKCGERYPFKSQLEDHLKKHKTMNSYCYAINCRNSFKNKSNLNKHVLTHHGTMHQCPVKDCTHSKTSKMCVHTVSH